MPSAPPRSRSQALRALPGAVLHCVLLTVLTVTLSALTGWTEREALVRPLFFALLYSFFRSTGQRYPHIRDLPLRLVESGFLVLTLGAAASAAMVTLDPDGPPWCAQLRLVLDRGAIFLLGLVLIAYGIVLWLPLLLENHRQLADSFRKSQGDLREAESARTTLEQKLVEQHRLTILGELAASIAHDLRNPFAIVQGAADALLRKSRSPDAVAEHAAIIRRGVEKADRTIQALIDVGRPRRAERRALPLAEPVREVLALVQVEGRRRGVAFAAAVEGIAVRADRELLVQVLLNLALNAAQASPANGTVHVRARPCRWRGGRSVAIVVEDRGHGLPPEARHRLFTPFYTTRSGGTGLGLLSSRRLAVEMDGCLGLYPRRRGGARALLVLPAADASAPAGDAAREATRDVAAAGAPGAPR
jgi:signal transduction histidine kinase